MPRCSAKTLAGRRCKKSGTRNGFCAIHEPAAAHELRNELLHLPNREGPNDMVRPEYREFMTRREALRVRWQAILPSAGINWRILGTSSAEGRLVIHNIIHTISSVRSMLAPLRVAANPRLSQRIKDTLDELETQISSIEQRAAAQNRANAERQRVLEAARQRARQMIEEQERVAARLAEQQANLREDLRLRPVVFRRDPDGSIDLRAFAEDAQSVHRSSVQNSTHKAVVELLSRPPPLADQDTLPEIVGIFNTSTTLRWSTPEARETVVTELTDNYFNMIAFSISYGRVVDYIWSYIRNHDEKAELTQRLAEELSEGRGMCSNGKMARLINVLQGYDESLATAAPRDLFQQRMAELSSKPMDERADAARALFTEFRIPEDEHTAWLEPLLDA